MNPTTARYCYAGSIAVDPMRVRVMFNTSSNRWRALDAGEQLFYPVPSLDPGYVSARSGVITEPHDVDLTEAEGWFRTRRMLSFAELATYPGLQLMSKMLAPERVLLVLRYECGSLLVMAGLAEFGSLDEWRARVDAERLIEQVTPKG